MREMQIPFRKIMVRQEDMGREVVGSNPVLAKDFFFLLNIHLSVLVLSSCH